MGNDNPQPDNEDQDEEVTDPGQRVKWTDHDPLHPDTPPTGSTG